jgi:hypothetical protein
MATIKDIRAIETDDTTVSITATEQALILAELIARTKMNNPAVIDVSNSPTIIVIGK